MYVISICIYLCIYRYKCISIYTYIRIYSQYDSSEMLWAVFHVTLFLWASPLLVQGRQFTLSKRTFPDPTQRPHSLCPSQLL